MKRAAFAILVLSFLLVPAAAFLRLDRNLLNAQVQKQIAAQGGGRLEFQSAAFRFFPFPAFELKEIRLFSSQDRLVFRAPEGQVKLYLRPLLQGKAVIQKIFFREAEIVMERSGQGRWLWFPAALAMDSGADSGTASPLQAMYIEKSTLKYRDHGGGEPFEAVLQEVDLLLMPADSGLVWQIDLSARVQGSTGQVFFTGLYDRRQDILFFRAADDQERVTFEGALLSLIYLPVFEGQAGFAGIERKLGKPGSEPVLEGIFSLELEGSVRGAHPAEIRKSMMAEGAFDVRSGRMGGVNLVRSVIEETLRGLDLNAGGAAAGSAEAEIYLGKGTPFDSVQGDISVLEQKITLMDTLIKHPLFMVELQGDFLAGDMEADMVGRLILLESLSQYAAGIHEVFNNFRNEAGRVVIPFGISGLYPEVAVKPDLDYLRSFLRGRNLNEGADAPMEEVGNAASGSDRHGER